MTITGHRKCHSSVFVFQKKNSPTNVTSPCPSHLKKTQKRYKKQDHNQRQCYCPETFWIAESSPITALIRMPPEGFSPLKLETPNFRTAATTASRSLAGRRSCRKWLWSGSVAIDLTVELHGCHYPGLLKPEKKKQCFFPDFLLILGGCLYEWKIKWDEHI